MVASANLEQRDGREICMGQKEVGQRNGSLINECVTGLSETLVSYFSGLAG